VKDRVVSGEIPDYAYTMMILTGVAGEDDNATYLKGISRMRSIDGNGARLARRSIPEHEEPPFDRESISCHSHRWG
jgi:hypothetical protein